MGGEFEPEKSQSAVKSKKATWGQAFGSFFSPIIIVLLFRWILFEAYVIPSGSMLPTLLINDHIFVNKWIYGLRWPFSESWAWRWSTPEKGEIVVFKYPKDKSTFFVKRVVAVAGDEIRVNSGQLLVNGQAIERVQYAEYSGPAMSEDFDFFLENLNGHKFTSRSSKSVWHGAGGDSDNYGPFRVPDGQFFVVGDNRDESSDSRVWGTVPLENLMGRVTFIWLSCENKLPSMPFICDPKAIRWNRLFKSVHE